MDILEPENESTTRVIIQFQGNSMLNELGIIPLFGWQCRMYISNTIPIPPMISIMAIKCRPLLPIFDSLILAQDVHFLHGLSWLQVAISLFSHYCHISNFLIFATFGNWYNLSVVVIAQVPSTEYQLLFQIFWENISSVKC